MGATKSHIFTDEQQRFAAFARVLSHPARVAITEYIAKQEHCICSDLTLEIGLAQSTVSQHLKELKQVGLLKGNFEGPQFKYCIDTEVWDTIRDQFYHFFTALNPQNCKADDTY